MTARILLGYAEDVLVHGHADDDGSLHLEDHPHNEIVGFRPRVGTVSTVTLEVSATQTHWVVHQVEHYPLLKSKHKFCHSIDSY